ncbi:hypothetical protein ABZP36_014098 [Zizania latifolia]
MQGQGRQFKYLTLLNPRIAASAADGLRRRKKQRVRGMQSCSGIVWLVLAFSWQIAVAQSQQAPKTDPTEVAALNTIFRRWGLKASSQWNISGEPCSGFASEGIDWDNYRDITPFIKCVCSYNNNTVCHITRLYVHPLTCFHQLYTMARSMPFRKEFIASLDLG